MNLQLMAALNTTYPTLIGGNTMGNTELNTENNTELNTNNMVNISENIIEKNFENSTKNIVENTTHNIFENNDPNRNETNNENNALNKNETNNEIYEAIGNIELEVFCKTYYARKKGKSHVIQGTVCQDYCSVTNLSENIQVVCVADGHGGKEYTKSDKGSYYACHVFTDLVSNIMQNNNSNNDNYNWLNVFKTPDFKKTFIDAWKKRVLEDYYDSSIDNSDKTESSQNIIRKYGTTFLFTIYAKDYFVIGQIGDGAILMSNDLGNNQLFKRHNDKYDSSTSSLVSNRAEYDFAIDIFEADYFNRILLSTDGIYDKLDTNDAFSLYEQELVTQVKDTGELKEPFTVQGIDVSNITRDDCTIALIKLADKNAIARNQNFNNNDSQNIDETEKIMDNIDWAAKGFENVNFYRHVNGLTIYEGKYMDKDVEIHLYDSEIEQFSLDINTAKLLKPEEIIALNEFQTAYIYSVPDNFHRVATLIDSGDHLEKHYSINTNDLENEELIDNFYTNNFWLSFYEQMIALDKELNELHIAVKSYFTECLFVSNDNNIMILSGAIKNDTCVANSKSQLETVDISNPYIQQLLAKFSIIGSLSCEEMAIPIFATQSQGQNIYMLHNFSEKVLLGKVIYNKEKNMFGLWNGTDSTWILDNGKNNEKKHENIKEIPAGGVIKLNKDQIFYLQTAINTEDESTEVTNGNVKYQIKMLRR